MHAPATLRCPKSGARARHAGGFTMVELMTAVVVAAVLLAAAGPGLAGFIRSSRVNAAQSELVSSMMLARSEAVKRGREVQLLAAAGPDDNDFSTGWLVAVDINEDGAVDRAEGSPEVIRRYSAPAAGIVVRTGAAAPAVRRAPAVRFGPAGFLASGSSAAFSVYDGPSGRNAPDGTARGPGFCITLEAVGLADVSDRGPCP